MADVREKVEQIRQAVYGKEVRESIASGIEAINTEVESTTQRQTTLETDMAEAKREAEEAATRANTAAGDAEDITEAMAVWEEYDPDNDYAPLNKVAYQGSSYINVLACKGVPPTEETHWLPIASKGDQGVPGPMPTLVVGDTTTLSPGSAATVTRRAGSPDAAPVLDFGIPRGVDGTGSGDMSKAIYDDNDDGKVNAADVADAVPTGAITDDMLSNDPNHIKARLSSHMVDNASVKDFGAKGDGATDDTAAIQACVNFIASKGGGIVNIPSGTFKITTPIIISNTRVSIVGQGENTIIMPYNCNGIEIKDNAFGYYLAWYGFIKNIKIDGTNAGITTHAIYAPYVRYGVFDSVHLTNFSGGAGITFVTANPQPTTPTGLYCGYITIKNPMIRNCKYGLEFTKVDDSITKYSISTDIGSPTLVSMVKIIGSGFINHNNVAICIDNGIQFSIDSVDISANTIVGCFIGKSCRNVEIRNIWHEQGSKEDIVVHKDAHVNILDTRTYTHIHGDTGIRRDTRSRTNVSSKGAVLTEGSHFQTGDNVIVNGRFQEWDIDQPKYWRAYLKNTNYTITQVKDSYFPNAGAHIVIQPSSNGGFLAFPFYVHEYDTGEVLTFSIDYKCSGDPSGLESPSMFNIGIYATASNGSLTQINNGNSAFTGAQYADTWQRISYSVKIPSAGRYSAVINFNTNPGQSSVNYYLKNAMCGRGYFASCWKPSKLEMNPNHDIYYEERFFGTMPSTNTVFYIYPKENIGTILNSICVISGKNITAKPIIAYDNRERVAVTPNDGVDAEYLIILRYIPETWSSGGFAHPTGAFKTAYFL